MSRHGDKPTGEDRAWLMRGRDPTDLFGIERTSVHIGNGDRPMSKKADKKSSPKPPRRYRDASTGRFVTKKYAKKNRKTTMKESIEP